MSIDDQIKNDNDKNKEKEESLASLHPLLDLKLQRDKENRQRVGKDYSLLYEKTYSGGDTDNYESFIRAANDEDAVKYAVQKLFLKDALAIWSTNITDALLITPTGEELLVPGWSKKK